SLTLNAGGGGSILDDGNQGTVVTAANMNLAASVAIGAPGNGDLDTSVINLTVNTGAGGSIHVLNTGATMQNISMNVNNAADDVLVTTNGGAIDSVTVPDTLRMNGFTAGQEPNVSLVTNGGNMTLESIALGTHGLTLVAAGGGSILDDGNQS